MPKIRNEQSAVGDAWVEYTPALSAGSGSFSNASATGRYKKIGKTVHFTTTVTIVSNGTAGSSIVIGLPFASIISAMALGRENASVGFMIQGLISGSTVTLFSASNTYPGANGYSIIISGTYETS